MKQLFTSANHALVRPELASRRDWLKGFSALLGTGLLAAAPSALLAGPATPAAPLPASAQVGGDEYIGVVKLLAGPEVPQGWARCEGQLLPVADHPALFAILGSTYGGDGRRTFALPDQTDVMGTGPEHPVAAGAPAPLIAIKVANAVAVTTALDELRLQHSRRTRLQA